jgi:hypothetical protein
MLERQECAETPGELAAANQYSGEVVLSIQARQEKNVLRSVLTPEVMASIDMIETDEPGHVALGRDLLLREAAATATRRRCAAAQEEFLTALVAQHSAELGLLGAERVRALPRFV